MRNNGRCNSPADDSHLGSSVVIYRLKQASAYIILIYVVMVSELLAI